MKSIVRFSIFGLVVAFGAGPAYAVDTRFYEATIKKLVTNAETGLCAAWISPGPATQGLTLCNNRWITFDCEGTWGSKSSGTNSFSLAQLAFVTGRSISVNVTDGSRIDVGSTQYCLADQVQVSP